MRNYIYGAIIILILIVVHLPASRESFDANENTNKEIKILHLVLYSSDDGGPYDRMRNITEKYYSRFPNVKTVYYRFMPNLVKDAELVGNVLYIKGKETYIPGIIDKTVSAFDYFKDEISNYHYVIRSNISTIIRFDELSSALKRNSVDYGCALCFGMEHVNNKGAVPPETIFSSGTSIVLSQKATLNLIDNKEHVDKTIIDDVSIGKFVNQKMPEIDMKPVVHDRKDNGFLFVPNVEANKEKLKTLISNNNFIFFRNNNGDRDNDAKQMEVIVEHLLSQ